MGTEALFAMAPCQEKCRSSELEDAMTDIQNSFPRGLTGNFLLTLKFPGLASQAIRLRCLISETSDLRRSWRGNATTPSWRGGHKYPPVLGREA